MSAAVTQKTQNMIFATELLPSLFHGSPEQFIYYLDRDGNKFLRFYWDQAGKKGGSEEGASSFGLNYLTRPLPRNAQIILISLPEVSDEFEVYYSALIYRPYRRMPFGGLSDTSKVVALERVYDSQGNPGTRLYDIDRRLRKEIIGPGPEPAKDAFLKVVGDLLEDG